jgi:hypothetical protein
MIATAGLVLSVGCGLTQPLFSSWEGVEHWLVSMVVLSSPFIVLLALGVLGLRTTGARGNKSRQSGRISGLGNPTSTAELGSTNSPSRI